MINNICVLKVRINMTARMFHFQASLIFRFQITYFFYLCDQNYLFMATNLVRVRFAPSPTGPLHIGGLRTALFNYLFANKYDGTFILRIEDTDQSRYVKGAEEYILESLKWCGLIPDEGPEKAGPFGPYRQSERQDIYKEYAEKLVALNYAYYAFDTPEELDELRKEYERKGQTFTYDASVRGNLKNSISLSQGETDSLIQQKKPYVIRYRFPENREIIMHDRIRGEVRVSTSTLDDKILFKSDGMPTYHLANVVDDHLMKITHVIRGEEWLPSLPLHFSLYRAFGWEESMPHFAHLPLILKPTGKGKLSKRDGEKGGFPVFPLEWKDPKTGEISKGYRESGYFPEAVLNILAFLGWNPGSDQEIFHLDELIQHFDLSKVGKAGSKFDPDKARWYNHIYLQEKDNVLLAKEFVKILNEKGIESDITYLEKVIGLVKERADFISDLWDHSAFFFKAPDSYDEKVIKKRWKENTPGIMKGLLEVIENCEPFTHDNVEKSVKTFIEENEYGMGAVMNAWRLILVGESKGPGLFDIAVMIGKEETIKRMEHAFDKLPG